MISTTLTFAPGFAGNGLRPGDVVEFPPGATSLLPRGGSVPLKRVANHVTRGPDKGCTEWETVDGKIVRIKPEVPVTVTRQVPDQAERDAFVEADRRFSILVRVVEAREEVEQARRKLAAALTDDRLDGALVHRPMGGNVLRDLPADLEVAVATFRAIYREHHLMLTSMGHTLDEITRMAADGRLSGALFEHAPRKPRNADCYADGRPADVLGAQHSGYVAPMQPEQS